MDFGRIKMALGFQDDAMIAKLLATLCINPKCRILNRTSDGEKAKTISSTDKFSANMTFSSPRRVLKIPGPTTEETHNKERIEEDRSIAVEAAIVRIMKARKLATSRRASPSRHWRPHCGPVARAAGARWATAAPGRQCI